VRYFYCHKHGQQEKRPCPECKKAYYAKPRTSRRSGYRARMVRARTLASYDHRCAALIDGRRCTVRAPLEAHHVDGDPSNDLPTNLVPLCRNHHIELAGLPFESFALPSTPFVL
jgi:predicted restriction endonuclease